MLSCVLLLLQGGCTPGRAQQAYTCPHKGVLLVPGCLRLGLLLLLPAQAAAALG
jgi:hypothetical protein